ncbi:hypothetical protein [Phenylobacterium sp.]|uniref:hypothetical protein n=1 Tax=Phenylobacterium sp. TaxID=1871053 RepID=UPI00120B67F8|nr:hypothetical protein [Phenylobacterium sp.]TAL32908.1 MAG: hypothetical protein EPN98_12600 [Phenylobacterium sp.]
MRVAFAPCLILGAALIASPALADEEPVATASATAAPVSTSDQIDAFIRSSPAASVAEPGEVSGVVARDDRKVHGEVSVGVGTGGYRSVYVRTDMPLGETGRLSLAFEDTRYGRSGGPYGHYPYGAGAFAGPIDRQRCDLEEMSAGRPLDRIGGPHGHCVGRGR